MKKLIMFIVPVLLITGCSIENESNLEEKTQVDEKPLTKQICDYTGMLSGSIIEEQRNLGYRFTGKSGSWYCGDDMLNFELIDELEGDK